MKIPILGTGLSGLVGSRIVDLLSSEFIFEDLSLKTGVDIIDEETVLKRFESSPSKVVLHMAAKTDVDACEDDKILLEEGGAWLINVVGTENIVKAAQKTGKKMIFISTDFVFDGNKDTFKEEDEPNPLNWYGRTKFEGELLTTKLQSWVIIRIAYPYRAEFPEKKDFVRRILEKMKNKEKIVAVTDHIITPTFIDDIAIALKFILKRDICGIYHVVGSQSLSVYDACCMIADYFGFKTKIEPQTREIYFKGKAFRPFNLALKNDKITKLGLRMRRFDEGLFALKRQMI